MAPVRRAFLVASLLATLLVQQCLVERECALLSAAELHVRVFLAEPLRDWVADLQHRRIERDAAAALLDVAAAGERGRG